MASWQSKALTTVFRLKKIFTFSRGAFDVAKERAELEATVALFKPPAHCSYSGIDVAGIQGEWIQPLGCQQVRAILYLHGGSYNAGSINSHRALAAYIGVAASAKVLIIDYRLAPEHPFPAAVEDAVAAYEWLVDQGYTSSQMAIVGDSAGGGLTLACLLSLRDNGTVLPAAGVCLSPWTDLAGQGESWHTKVKQDLIIDVPNLRESGRLYAGERNLFAPLASPIYANLVGLPPLLIQVGTEEVLLSDATTLASLAEEGGVDVTLEIWGAMQHVWQFTANLVPEGRQAVNQIGQFLQMQWG